MGDLAIKNLPVYSHTPLSHAMVKLQQGKDNDGHEANTKGKEGHMARGVSYKQTNRKQQDSWHQDPAR